MIQLRISTFELSVFLSIMLRMSLAVFMIPLINNARFPHSLKALFIIMLSALLFPVLRHEVAPLSFDPVKLALTVIEEVIFSMVISFSVLLILAAFDMAGELMSYMTGLGFVQVVDPQSGAQTNVVSNILQLFAVLLLFGLNAHHVLLKLIVDSFHTVPVGQFAFQTATVGKIVVVFIHLFTLSVKLAAPVVVVLLLTQVGMGMIARFVPNINILVTSFPITILLGLIFIGLSMPLWAGALNRAFLETATFLQNLIHPGVP
jgi:flagellar biosynthetic protein FliR